MIPAQAIGVFDSMTDEQVGEARTWLATAADLSRRACDAWEADMASAPSEPRAVLGRVDKAGRLIAADPELEALQREAGAAIGADAGASAGRGVAQLARKLGIAVSRPAVAASADHDIELWVQRDAGRR